MNYRIIDGRTKEGKQELIVKGKFNELLTYILVDNMCKNVPGEFIKKHCKDGCSMKGLKSDYIKDDRLV